MNTVVNLDKAYVGSSEVNKIYLGNILLYEDIPTIQSKWIDTGLAKYIGDTAAKNQVQFINIEGDFVVPYVIDSNTLVSAENMFADCTDVTSIDCRNLDTSNITSMRNMFFGCTNARTINISGLQVDNVEDISEMFYGCLALESADLSMFSKGTLTNVSGVFGKCFNIKRINLKGLNTSNVTSFTHMFFRCETIEELDVSSLDTSSGTWFAGMFNACYKLNNIDVTGFVMPNAVNLANMFMNCEAMTRIVLNNANITKVNDFRAMVAVCPKLEYLDISGIKDFTTLVENGNISFFNECNALNHVVCSSRFRLLAYAQTEAMKVPPQLQSGGSGTWEVISN